MSDEPHRRTWPEYLADTRAAWKVAEAGRDVVVSDGGKKRMVLGGRPLRGSDELFSGEEEKNLRAEVAELKRRLEAATRAATANCTTCAHHRDNGRVTVCPVCGHTQQACAHAQEES